MIQIYKILDKALVPPDSIKFHAIKSDKDKALYLLERLKRRKLARGYSIEGIIQALNEQSECWSSCFMPATDKCPHCKQMKTTFWNTYKGFKLIDKKCKECKEGLNQTRREGIEK
mgnify:CR=1 FL=1